ncbi:MAG: hypothetical protein LBJ31_00880 [Treponema sp.]|jgi:hypothetical protein|nr:hypothetical protein [Treponema sp.]
MNTSLLNVVKQITSDYGEAVLADPARLKAFFSDLAKNEPKPLRIAFGRCIEAGAYDALKDAPDATERTEHKALIVQKVHEEHGLDIGLCNEALDILEAALPEEKTAVRPVNAEEDQAQNALANGEAQSEETGNLQKIIAEKNEELIRCVQNIERLTEEKKQSDEERQFIISKLKKTITEKDEEIIRHDQTIVRLTKEKDRADEARQLTKGRLTAAIWLGLIAVGISIAVGYNKYQEMENAYYSKSWDYDTVSSDYKKLLSDYNTSKNIWAVAVTKLEVGNADRNNKWITRPGERLDASAIRYLNPVITVDSLIDREIAISVKIIDPSGTLKRNTDTSPPDYTYSKTRRVWRDKNIPIDLYGWGNADTSHFSAGEWTVEVWYEDVCLRSEKVRIN